MSYGDFKLTVCRCNKSVDVFEQTWMQMFSMTVIVYVSVLNIHVCICDCVRDCIEHRCTYMFYV